MKWARIERFIYLSTRFHRKEQSAQCFVAGAHAVCNQPAPNRRSTKSDLRQNTYNKHKAKEEMATVKELLEFRRAVRNYDTTKSLDPEKVKACLEAASLAPTSSNLQLWEVVHVTDKETIRQLGPACFDQTTITSADELVVFLIRPDLVKAHAKAILDFERVNVARNYPAEKHAKYMNLITQYYTRLVPFLYGRCLGLFGLLRETLMSIAGLFRAVPRSISENDMLGVMHKSCGLVAQSFMLGMAEQGYDTCPVEGFDAHRVKRLLKLPRQARVSLIVSCGIRIPKGVRGDRFRLDFDTQYRRV